jgi:hypothetical protein
MRGLYNTGDEHRNALTGLCYCRNRELLQLLLLLLCALLLVRHPLLHSLPPNNTRAMPASPTVLPLLPTDVATATNK